MTLDPSNYLEFLTQKESERIFPDYQRNENSLIQSVRFDPVFYKTAIEMRLLEKQLQAEEDVENKKMLVNRMNYLASKRALYEDKVAYTVQYSTGRPKKICLLFHGMGDHAGQIAKHAPRVDDVLYIVPQAFHPFRIMGPFNWNFQWFDIGSVSHPDKERIKKGAALNRPILMDWIDDLVHQHSMTYDDVILCGFSQGAVTALDLLMQSPHLKYAIAVAGAVDLDLTIDQTDKHVLLVHHPLDPMVPYEEATRAKELLKTLNANVTLQHSQTKGHLIFQCTQTQEYMRHFIQAIKGE